MAALSRPGRTESTDRVPRPSETDRHPPVQAFLEGLGYAVKSEIGNVDVLAVRGGGMPMVVERKTGFSPSLLTELGVRTEAAHHHQQQPVWLSAAMGTIPVPEGASALVGATRLESAAASAPAPSLTGATAVAPNAGLPSQLGTYRVLGLIDAHGLPRRPHL